MASASDTPGSEMDHSVGHWIRSRKARLTERLSDRGTRAITAALLTAAVALIGAWIYWVVLLAELPATDDLQKAGFERATVVYSADGVKLTSYQDKNRSWVELDEISEWVPKALIATEDHRFYEHNGIDVMRTIGSAFQTLAGDVQGGSTITMQLARNAYPDIYDDWMFTRKVKEWITAVRLEAMYEKDEIMEMYLNTVPFMYNAFGIEAASKTYFQIPASELNVKAAATLVGMLKGTVFYNPVRHPDRSHERRNVVLEQMARRGYIDQSEFEALMDERTLLDFERLSRANEPAPHFAEYLRQWLDDWAERYNANLYTDGLRVYTTINFDLQEAGQAAVDQVGDQLQDVANRDVSVSRYWNENPQSVNQMIRQTNRYRSLTESGVSGRAAIDSLRGAPSFVDSLQSALRHVQAGLLALDPRNGSVLAWIGGRDFGQVQYDHVAMSKRQPGSTFKPFVYAAALASGYSQTSLVRDQVIEYVDPDTRRRWRPTNVGGASGRMMTLADALAYSKNTVTAQLVQDIGPERVAEYAHRMGIQSELREVPSIGLGTSEVSLLEMAGAYGTLANYGRYRQPTFVTRIEDAQGNVVARFSSDSRQAIPSTVAYSVIDMMRGVADYGTGVRIRNTYGVRGDVAAKTGTSQNGADGWFMLVHPNLIVGSWVGFASPSIHFQSGYYQQGAHTALPIVGRFYQQARSISSDLLSTEATFNPPAGWVEPHPVDTTSRSDYLFASYSDSLNARRDSLFRALSDSGYSFEDDFDFDSLDDGRNGEEVEREEDIEGVEEADRLNRLERQDDTAFSGDDGVDPSSTSPENGDDERGAGDDDGGGGEGADDGEPAPNDNGDDAGGPGGDGDEVDGDGGANPDRGSETANGAGGSASESESDAGGPNEGDGSSGEPDDAEGETDNG